MYKYKKQYRYKGYDYSRAGMYFVTICTKDRKMFFGKILGKYHDKFVEDAIVKLSKAGQIVKKCWLEIPHHFPFVRLDEFIIMPNHIHGIVIIDNKNTGTQNIAFKSKNKNTGTQNIAFKSKNKNTGTQDVAFLREYKNKFGPQLGNLSSIIRGFKIGVTKYANKNNIEFAWQSRFHDRIIRNEMELLNIRNYIINNPFKWMLDRNNIDELKEIDKILNN